MIQSNLSSLLPKKLSCDFKIADFFIESFSGVVVPICIHLGSKPTVNIYIELFW